jgi:hypothetical protein
MRQPSAERVRLIIILKILGPLLAWAVPSLRLLLLKMAGEFEAEADKIECPMPGPTQT